MYLQFGQWDDIRIQRALPNSSLTLGIIIVVAFGIDVEEFPPLILVCTFTENERKRGRENPRK